MKFGMDCGENSVMAGEVLLFMTWEMIKDVHPIMTYNNLRNCMFVQWLYLYFILQQTS